MNLGLRPAASPEAHEEAGTSLATAMLRCRTASLRVSRLPAVSSPSRPLAVFLPDALTDLPSACRTAAPLAAMFDVTVCELPGHGGSGQVADVSPIGFAQEYAALVDGHVPPGRRVTLVGAGFGGLVALELARLRSERVARVILLDTPFVLTRKAAAAALCERWRRAPSEAGRRLLRDVFGVDPEGGPPGLRMRLHDMVEDIDFPCAVISGSDQGTGEASLLTDADFDALHDANAALLMPCRLEHAGHRVLDDDPAGCVEMLARLVAVDELAAAG